LELKKIMESYSQCGIDIFVYNILKKDNGTFLDLGCYLPKNINNTYLLELNGWTGISLDIIDYNEEWKERKNKFIQQDCMNTDLTNLLDSHYNNKVIDYLSLDMEVLGDRFKLLEKVLKTNYEFKVITIEHDSYLSGEYESIEKLPQRELLKQNGYILLCGDVSQKEHPTLFYEDWWVNSKYFNEEDLTNWFSDKMSCDKIFNKLNINYNVNEISKKW
jgi:hypothetical protein